LRLSRAAGDHSLRSRIGRTSSPCGARVFAWLRPLPYPKPGRLVRVFEWTPRNPKFPLSIYNYLETRRAQNTLESSRYGRERRRGVREKSWWRLTHLRKDNHSASPQTDSLTIRCDSTCSLVPQIAFDSHPYIPARVSSHRNRASRDDAFWPFDCVADGTARYGATRILWCGEDAECQPDERYSNLGF
jgi:hypothetical protein